MSANLPNPNPAGTTSTFSVNDMSCEHCVQSVKKAIEGVAGVQSVIVSLESKLATVNWTLGTSPNAEAVVQAVQQAGYQAAVMAG